MREQFILNCVTSLENELKRVVEAILHMRANYAILVTALEKSGAVTKEGFKAAAAVLSKAAPVSIPTDPAEPPEEPVKTTVEKAKEPVKLEVV